MKLGMTATVLPVWSVAAIVAATEVEVASSRCRPP
jgi:hypothetical protein